MLKQDDIDLGGLIHISYIHTQPNDCEHNGSTHKFSESIDTLQKNDLSKNLMNEHKTHTRKHSIDQPMVQRSWETWGWHIYLLVKELVMIHIDKKMLPKA